MPRITKSWDQAGVEEIGSLQVSSSDTWRKSLSSKGTKSFIHIEPAIGNSKVLTIARQQRVSLSVLDTVRKGIGRNGFIHSLINRASIPVLIIKMSKNNGSSYDERSVFETVVIALDFSPAYDKALKFLLNFKELITTLEIVNVITSKLTIRDIRDLKQKLQVSRRLCIDKGIDTESHVYAGKTAEEIITSAIDYKATLIVLGISNKLTLFKRLFRRGAVYTIAEESPISVLIVP